MNIHIVNQSNSNENNGRIMVCAYYFNHLNLNKSIEFEFIMTVQLSKICFKLGSKKRHRRTELIFIQILIIIH